MKNAGFSPEQLKDAGFSAGDLLKAGFTPADLAAAGFTPSQIKAGETELPNNLSPTDIKNAGCDVQALQKEQAEGVSADLIKQYAGCTDQQLAAAGFNTARPNDCSVDALKKAKAAGISASVIKKRLGCSAQAFKDAGYSAKELKDAGFTPAELKAAGFSAKDLKDAGFSPKELKDAGFSAQELKDAGFNAKQLKDAGFSPADLKKAGFSAAQLKDAGFTAKDLKDAGFAPTDLQAAGFSPDDIKAAGYSANQLAAAGIVPPSSPAVSANPALGQNPSSLASLSATTTGQSGTPQTSSNQLQAILNKQNDQLAEQKYQQKIQQRTAEMQAAANQAIQGWKQISTQVYTAGNEVEKDAVGASAAQGANNASGVDNGLLAGGASANAAQKAFIKTGDIIFAVLDTSVNSDEPGPILATVVSGRFKGTKLIGSFNLPANANSMVISFNTMSVPGAAKTTSISAYAIDPNTARTALSSRTNHHYLMRYGSLFASSFLEGFGNAFQSANTTVTIGGTGGGNNITVQNGIGRSTLQNAVIGLATVGKSWGQAAQQLFSTPTTVEVYSGTGLGVLFTQDVTNL